MIETGVPDARFLRGADRRMIDENPNMLRGAATADWQRRQRAC
jgi:hypothetical protein